MAFANALPELLRPVVCDGPWGGVMVVRNGERRRVRDMEPIDFWSGNAFIR